MNYYKQQDTYLPWLVNVSFTLDGPSVKDVTVSSGNVSYVGQKPWPLDDAGIG